MRFSIIEFLGLSRHRNREERRRYAEQVRERRERNKEADPLGDDSNYDAEVSDHDGDGDGQ